MYQKTKKAISTVVAVVLLILITIFISISFNNWNQEYFSNMVSDVEQTNTIETNTGIEGIIGGKLSFYNEGNKKKITTIEINQEYCDVEIEINKKSSTLINISDCTQTISTGMHNIKVLTDAGLYQKSIFIEVISPGIIK